MNYDFLIVGAGLFGAVFAHEAAQKGKKCLVVERRGQVGGNVYCEKRAGINVHRYGAHIFHTSDREVWEYVNRFADFEPFVNSPVAVYRDGLYNLPFNMNTFHQLWGVVTPAQAKAKIAEQVCQFENPQNLEEQALSLAGRDIYEKLIKGYTEKQWGRDCRELPAFIIRRIPLRFTYDNNYFSDRFQGIPSEGYTALVEGLLAGTEVLTDTDYREFIVSRPDEAEKTVFTGCIDEFFDYRLGALQYRSLRFESEELPVDNFQGNAVVNYTERSVPYTRIIEHKHFTRFCDSPTTVITREFPAEWRRGDEPYYPVNDEKNNALYERYQLLAQSRPDVIFCGRLGRYRYVNMDETVASALRLAKEIL